MGVPRFFRFLVERYPLILRDYGLPVPEIDNFYLDFNGVVHTCTHGNTDVVRTQKEMMMLIFSYLEQLLELMPPQKLLFIAIDGVAPRAKMNQQRQRRFRSAKQSEIDEANKNVEIVAGGGAAGGQGGQGEEDETFATQDEPFDSNCITPGTAFMEELDRHLVYFIQRKIDEDHAWRRIKVVLSGHQVPGEGEHKIMEFIRSLKSMPDYDPNTRHCLHGLDADLIMLGLAVHEPHFCILRESVIVRNRHANTLNSSAGKSVSFQSTTSYQMIYIGLLREYIALELLPEASERTHQSEAIERAVDDFVFLTYFLGNDFLPHLPTADIDDDGLSSLFEFYRNTRAVLKDNLVDAKAGTINPAFLEALFTLFAQREPAFYESNREKHLAKNKRRGGDKDGEEDDDDDDDDDDAAAAPDVKAVLDKAFENFVKGPAAGGGAASAAAAAPAPVRPNAWGIKTPAPRNPTRPSPVADKPASAPSPAPKAQPPQQQSVAEKSEAAAEKSAAAAEKSTAAAEKSEAAAEKSTAAAEKSEAAAEAPKKKGHGQFYHPSELTKGRALAPQVVAQRVPAKSNVQFTRKEEAAGAAPEAAVGDKEEEKEVAKEEAVVDKVEAAAAPADATAKTAAEPATETAAAEATAGAPAPADAPADPNPADPNPANPNPATDTADKQFIVSAVAVDNRDVYYQAHFSAVADSLEEQAAGDKQGLASREVGDICLRYLEGLVWVLRYYYQGLPSWSWYYPYFAAPLASDMCHVAKYCNSLTLTYGKPLLPFQQLLAVLPLASKALLPAPVAALMAGPLAKWYPLDYPRIPDEKGREWREIAVIPFINGEALVEAYDKHVTEDMLTPAERRRNRLMQARIFEFDAAAKTRNELPGVLPTTVARCVNKPFAPWPLPEGGFVPRLREGCWTGRMAPPAAFPTLNFLHVTAELELAGVQVVYGPSKAESLILRVPWADPLAQAPPGAAEAEAAAAAAANPERAEEIAENMVAARTVQLANSLLSNTCIIGYPFPHEGLVVGVYDIEGVWHLSKRGQVVKQSLPGFFEDKVGSLQREYKTRRGIDIGHTHLLIEVRPLEGMVTTLGGALSKRYADESVFVPAQLIPTNKPRLDARFVEKEAVAPAERFGKGDRVVLLGEDNFGDLAVITDKREVEIEGSSVVLFDVDIPEKRPERIEQKLLMKGKSVLDAPQKYVRSNDLAQSLHVSPLVLSRLSGSVTIDAGNKLRVDIGLCMKFARRELHIAGHVRRIRHPRRPDSYAWEYTARGAEIVRGFAEAFPDLFAGVQAQPECDKFALATLFLQPNGQPVANPAARLAACLEWLQACETSRLPLTPCDAQTFSAHAIQQIEEEAERVQGCRTETVSLSGVTPIELLPPQRVPLAQSSTDSQLKLGHRVVNLNDEGPVLFGQRGTVASLYNGKAEVIFDSPFLSAHNLDGKLNGFRGYEVPTWSLLNLTTRALVVARHEVAKASGKKKKKKGKSKGASASNPFAALMDD